jgi:hypothetical protein
MTTILGLLQALRGFFEGLINLTMKINMPINFALFGKIEHNTFNNTFNAPVTTEAVAQLNHEQNRILAKQNLVNLDGGGTAPSGTGCPAESGTDAVGARNRPDTGNGQSEAADGVPERF